jgi:GT2 family glycosyltransferase
MASGPVGGERALQSEARTVPAPAPVLGSVAAVILNWNQACLTLECVASVRSEVDHVYVVDNGSDPRDRALLSGLKDDRTTLIVNHENLGYAGGCNIGVEGALVAGFKAVLVMNNDAFPDPGSVRLLADRLDTAPWVGAVGPTVVQRHTRKVLHAWCSLDERTGRARWSETGAEYETLGIMPVPTGYLSGEAMLIRSEVIRKVGMFEPRYFCYYEDVDWSIRASRAGWRLEVVPQAVFEHVVGATSAGNIGNYYRARNLPLMLRTTCGRGRPAAFILSLPTELLWFGALLRRRRSALAFRGVLGGWLAGLTLRV